MKKQRIRNLPTGFVIREIGLAKNNLVSVNEFRELYEGDDSMLKIADIYEAYESDKRKKLLMDFNDLLIETYNLLHENTEVRKKYQDAYRHILVDEFQDVNPAQSSLLNLLVNNRNGNGASFWICGDDWQSIYSFTGASVGNILNFNKVYPNSKQFILDRNYRSTPQILRACLNLISHNVRRIDKELHANNGDGEQVIVLEASNEEDESIKIVNEIKDLVESGYEHKDIAVLYRANNQSQPIEEAFAKNQVPYHIENGTSFYERMEVKILLDYLRFIKKPMSDDGDDALRCILNIPNRYIGRRFINELDAYADPKGIRLYQALKSMRIDVPYVRHNVRSFINLMDPLIRDADTIGPSEMIYLLREGLDFDRFITEGDIADSPDNSKIDNVNQLVISANKYNDIVSLLNYTDTFKDERSNDLNGVSLMTIHKSKGLEFPVVFVVGMVEGVLPHKNGDIEEERRIAFVGISRAMQLLYMSYALKYMGKRTKKSNFLNEIQLE
jgi:DNA helicase-2/ATP-dependent DNA helicase PcrA